MSVRDSMKAIGWDATQHGEVRGAINRSDHDQLAQIEAAIVRPRSVSDGTKEEMCGAISRSDHGKLTSLLESGGSADDLGFCLGCACACGATECTRLLLASHAAVNYASERSGNTPLIVACFSGHVECAQLLLAAHAAVDQAGSDGTPLYAACSNGRGECARLLLAAHAAVDQPGRPAAEGGFGIMPLHAACSRGYVECAQLLLAAHAAVDQADNKCVTPLISACIGGFLDVVKLLIQAGARTDLRLMDGPNKGKLALNIAEAEGHTAIVRFLRTHRRAPTPATAAKVVTREEAAAAERAAELNAAALLAEEEAEEAQKKSKKASKSKRGGASQKLKQPAAEGSSSAAAGSAESTQEVETAAAADGEAASAAASAAADEAIRQAVSTNDVGVISRALEEHRAAASEAEVARARTVRDKLKERRKKESQKQRKAHGAMMMSQLKTQEAAMAEAGMAEAEQAMGSLALGAGTSTQPSAADAQAASGAAPAWAWPTTFAQSHATSTDGAAVHNWEMSVLSAATGGFAADRFIGKGGCALVYRAELPVTPPPTSPAVVAIKRAMYAEADHADLDRELALLERCRHAHLLPLLGYCRELEAPCLIFPLMRGGSLEMRLRLTDDNLTCLCNRSSHRISSLLFPRARLLL